MAVKVPNRKSIQRQLNAIASELERELLAEDSPEITNTTIYVLTNILVSIVERDLLALSKHLKELSEVCLDLSDSLDTLTANAVVLWAFTQCCEDELSGSDLSDIEEITSHRPEILSTVKSCLFQKKPREWKAILDKLVKALFRNILHLVMRKTGVNTEEIEEDEVGVEAKGIPIERKTVDVGPEGDNKEWGTKNSRLTTSVSTVLAESNDTNGDEETNIDQHRTESEEEGKPKEECMKENEEVVACERNMESEEEREEGTATMGSADSSIESLPQRLKGFVPKKRPLPTVSSESEGDDISSEDDSFNKVDLDDALLPRAKYRKKRGMWNDELTQKLVDGVNRIGVGRWISILKSDDFPPSFNNNTLRYKWKNLLLYNHVRKEGSKWVLV